jgi:uncharacterized protein YbjT (DUF2867 family)
MRKRRVCWALPIKLSILRQPRALVRCARVRVSVARGVVENPEVVMQKVLITGANGHLGRRLIAERGDLAVRAVVRSERARAQLEALDVETKVLDYGDAEALTRAAHGCTHVVHLVGIIKESGTSTYAQAHEATTSALIEAAAAVGLEGIITLSIVGAQPQSANPCLASKGIAAQMLLASETPALVLRVPMVLGENDFASRALSGRARSSLNVVFRGSSMEQPIYAGDVIAALLAALGSGATGALDLAGPESLSRVDLIRRAAGVVDRASRVISLPLSIAMAAAALLEKASANPPVTRAMLGVLDHDDQLDAGPACERLGIELTPLDETLRRCLNAETGWTGRG